MVVKGDRGREPFDEHKLRAGMEKALEKRPVAREQIDEAVSRICHKVRSLGEREVAARAIGELVMEELRHLDEVGLRALRLRVPAVRGRRGVSRGIERLRDAHASRRRAQ